MMSKTRRLPGLRRGYRATTATFIAAYVRPAGRVRSHAASKGTEPTMPDTRLNIMKRKIGMWVELPGRLLRHRGQPLAEEATRPAGGGLPTMRRRHHSR